MCTLVCEECFLDKNRLRLGSSASGLPWHHSPSTSGTARASVCVCLWERGSCSRTRGEVVTHQHYEKTGKNWTQDDVMYRKASCIRSPLPHSISANESEHVACAQELSAKHGLMVLLRKIKNTLCFLEDWLWEEVSKQKKKKVNSSDWAHISLCCLFTGFVESLW